MKKFCFILMCCLIVTSCSANNQKYKTEKVSILQTIQNKNYVLKNTLKDSEITLVFQKDNKIIGKSGVNNYFGNYKLNGNLLEISQCATTRMAGPTDLMKQEQDFLKKLSEAQSIHQTENGGIIITTSSGEKLEFEQR